MAATLWLAACAPDLGDSLGDGSESGAGSDDTTDGNGGGGPQVQHEDEGGGVTRTVIDATSEEAWVYLDLQSRQQVEIADPTASDAWDLGFHRFDIAIDGGISGPGGMEAVILEGVTFDEVDAAPSEGWVTDAVDGDDENEDPDLVFEGWYAYDFMTHVLTPHPLVYVVRSVEGDVYKVEIVDYYDEAGTSAIVAIRWAALADA